LTLRLADGQPTTARQLRRYLTTLTQRMRDCRKAQQTTCEYYIAIEFTGDQPHMHAAIITSLQLTAYKSKVLVSDWWASSCPHRQTAVYCARVRNVIGLANYLPKFLRDRRHLEMPPRAWSSYACRLVWRSRGFLSRGKTTLWQEQVQEWYPQRGTP
jgi:hypothetical protein